MVVTKKGMLLKACVGGKKILFTIFGAITSENIKEIKGENFQILKIALPKQLLHSCAYPQRTGYPTTVIAACPGSLLF